MKNLSRIAYFLFIIILSLIFSSRNNVYGQAFQSLFGNTNTSWNIVEGYCDFITTDSLFVIGDTLMEDHLYKIVYRWNTNFSSNAEDTLGYLREDSIQGKAWFYSSELEQEYLIYDLELSVGDTFWVTDYWEKLVPLIVDSIDTSTGTKHLFLSEFISICSEPFRIEFIEGVGTNAGIAYPSSFFDLYSNSYLLCQYKDDLLVYQEASLFDACNIHYTNTFDPGHKGPEMMISPNPVVSQAQISVIGEGRFDRIRLIDQFSNTLLQDQLIDNKYILETGSMSPGLYFIELYNEKGKRLVGSMIIMNN